MSSSRCKNDSNSTNSDRIPLLGRSGTPDMGSTMTPRKKATVLRRRSGGGEDSLVRTVH
jgi:hypothetical protein